MPGRVKAFTDGSTVPKNPGNGGAGTYLEWGNRRAEISSYLGDNITNNVAELMGIAQAFTFVLQECPEGTSVDIVSDSQYCIGVLSGRYGVSANRELIFTIKQTMEQLGGVTFQHVRGHTGVPGNEKADVLAGKAARGKVTTSTGWVGQELF